MHKNRTLTRHTEADSFFKKALDKVTENLLISGLVLLGFFVALFTLWWCCRNKSPSGASPSKKKGGKAPKSDLDSFWEVDEEQLNLSYSIGDGAVGPVLCGNASAMPTCDAALVQVAVKTCEKTNKVARKVFLAEAAMLAKVSKPPNEYVRSVGLDSHCSDLNVACETLWRRGQDIAAPYCHRILCQRQHVRCAYQCSP